MAKALTPKTAKPGDLIRVQIDNKMRTVEIVEAIALAQPYGDYEIRCKVVGGADDGRLCWFLRYKTHPIPRARKATVIA